jgi:hypothetical protein
LSRGVLNQILQNNRLCSMVTGVLIVGFLFDAGVSGAWRSRRPKPAFTEVSPMPAEEDFARARADWGRVLRIDPGYDGTRRNLERLGKMNEAPDWGVLEDPRGGAGSRGARR